MFYESLVVVDRTIPNKNRNLNPILIHSICLYSINFFLVQLKIHCNVVFTLIFMYELITFFALRI